MSIMYLHSLGLVSVKLADGRTMRGAFEAWAAKQAADLVAFLRAHPDTWVDMSNGQ